MTKGWRWRVWMCGLGVGICAACSSSSSVLFSAYPSPEALAAAVLDALARGDESALEALALTEQEFRDHVWPDLPAARPERNLPFSYVWGDLRQKGSETMAQTLSAHGGRTYALVSLW